MGRPDHPTEPQFSLHTDQDAAREAAARLFQRVATELKNLLPDTAEVRHIGATAVPGCLTKGDLDLVVRVPADAFDAAERALASRFPRNVGSKRTDSFSAFEDPDTNPHLGVQLVMAGSEDDVFHLFLDALLREPDLVGAYNALKRKFAGQPMETYRQAKDAFIREVLAR